MALDVVTPMMKVRILVQGLRTLRLSLGTVRSMMTNSVDT